MKCSVVNCNNSNEGKASICSFFRFPLDGTLRKKWISFCGRKKFNPNTAFVCMHHFKEEDFGNNLQYEMGFAKKRLLRDGAVPTINIASIQNDELYEQRARRIERRENKKTVNLLLENYTSGLMTSQENDYLQSNENTENAFEYIDIKMENIDDNERHQPEKQSEDILSSDVSYFHNINQKVETLEKEIVALRKEKEINDEALKVMKFKMEKMHKNHISDKEQMEKCLAKAKFDLAILEEKLQVIFTKGQIRKLKNGIKRQIWSEEDLAHSITLYDISPKMYKVLYKNQFPLPAVRTLQSWAQKLQVTSNLTTPVSHINEIEDKEDETKVIRELTTPVSHINEIEDNEDETKSTRDLATPLSLINEIEDNEDEIQVS